MFTKLFIRDALERALKTVAQTLIALWLVGDEAFNILTVNWNQAFGVSLGAGVLSILMSIASSNVGSTNSASLTVDTKELKK